MRILITGTTGFIGGHLVRHFAQQGHELIAWSRPKEAPPNLEKFSTYKSVDLLQAVPKIEVDACIHCAGYASDIGNWNTFYQNNVQTTINLFEAVKAKRWINVSSSSIYPLLSKTIEEEDVDLSRFPSLYGKSKYIAEQWMKDHAYTGQTIISLRPRGVYGTNDRVLLPRILKQGKSGTIKLPGGGRVKLSMTHVSNFVQAVDLSLHCERIGFHAYNVSDDEVYSICDVFQKVNEGFLEKEVKVKAIPVSFVRALINLSTFLGKPFPLTMQAFDYITSPSIIGIDKIKRELGYQPTTNFYKELDGLTTWARSVSLEKLYAAHKDLAWENY